MSNRLVSPLRSGTAASMFVNLLMVATALYAVLWMGDFGVHHPEWTPLRLWLDPDNVESLYGLSEVMVGVLAVALTVISIIVELAANRYTPRITDIFLRDRVNIMVLCGFVLSTVLVFWGSLSLGAGPPGHHPEAMVLVVELSVSMSLLALLPYFAYVFEFLSPTHLVRHVASSGVAALNWLANGGAVETAREDVVRCIDQLGDIVLKSVQNQDKNIASDAVQVITDLLTTHVHLKRELPDSWFDATDALLADSDFVSFHRDVIRRVAEQRTWVEMKVMLQLHSAYVEALHDMREVAHLVAIQTRRIGVKAAEADDGATVNLAIRFMNTYMRAAINGRDVRTAYNLFNEYRLFGKGLLGTRQQHRVVDLAEHMKAYGQLAFHAKLNFILETAAYDLCTLLEDAYVASAEQHAALLDIFLDVDREPVGEVQEAALRGVRKAQVKAATFYLVQGARDFARRIQRDMRHEKAARMSGIRKDIEETTEQEFWEVSDRGTNFDYLDPARRAQLAVFFSWFDEP